MFRTTLICLFTLFYYFIWAQTTVYRDTTPSVYENGIKLKMPWAGGLNFSSFSQIDLNNDGKQDIVSYDKLSGSGGKLRVYINKGGVGEATYLHGFTYQEQFPLVTDWAMFEDYNNDNKADLFTFTTGGIKVFKNTSVGAALSFVLEKSLLRGDYNPNGTPNLSNIPVSSVGLPGISDLDNDGDLDILTFSTTGIKVEFHQNMSKEWYGHSDSLVFDMVDNCWGDFQENSCSVDMNVCPYMKQYQSIVNTSFKKPLHSGSCIMCLDHDNDGDKELILGDISCSTVFYVENTGSVSNAHIGDTTVMYPNYPNKASTNIIKLNSFPCTYYLDVNNDGYKDLIASPNAVSGAENYQSVWYYKNTSSTPTVNFSFQQKNFLQDNMIELGEGSYPVLFDADADGKKDLIVGNLGYYTVNTNKSKLAFYKNIGTNTSPSFSLITRDYQNLSSFNLYSMAPTFGDLDGDGDKDLLIGSTNGRVHYFENSAGAGNPAIYTTHVANYQNILGNNFVYPQLFDMDKNGTLDVLLGSTNGRITYYKNVGSTTIPTFSFVTGALGGVDVRQLSIGSTTGYSMPFMFNDAGNTKLLVGSEIGSIFMYDNIDGNLSGTFNKVDTMLFGINEGVRCAPFYEDITSDGKRDLFLGNYGGGIAFFNSSNISAVGIEDIENEKIAEVYPNPANNKLNVSINNHHFERITINCYDVIGKIQTTFTTYNKFIEIDVSQWSKGIYIIQINTESGKMNSKKIIIE